MEKIKERGGKEREKKFKKDTEQKHCINTTRLQTNKKKKTQECMTHACMHLPEAVASRR